MIYYEWISLLEELKIGPRKEDVLSKLYHTKASWEGNIEYRFVTNVSKVVRTRLSLSLDQLLLRLPSLITDEHAFSLEILEIKKEILFAKKIIHIPVISEKNVVKLQGVLQRFANEIKETLEKKVECLDSTGKMLNIIQKNHLNMLEE